MAQTDRTPTEQTLTDRLRNWYETFGRLFQLTHLGDERTQWYLGLGVSIKALPAVRQREFRERIESIYRRLSVALWQWPDLDTDLNGGMDICGEWLFA